MTTAPSSAVEPRAAAAPPRTRRLRSAARFAAAFALPWILLEIGLRVTGWQPPDMRPRVALFPRFPAFYEPSRELGWVLKPKLDWQGMEVGIPFRTDAEGHRLHGDGSGGAPPAVDAIGDSSTFGFGVPESDTYPAQLERKLRASTGDGSLRVRNLGVPGYTAYEARILAERDMPRAPVTLVMMGFNDHFPATRTRFTSLWVRRAAYAWEPATSTSAGTLAAGFAGRSTALDDRGDFWRLGLDLQHFVRLGAGPRVLAVRGHLEALAGGGDDVPFHQLPALGGATLLRGFPAERFRDRSAAMVSAEYRWDLSRAVLASVFVDAGRVDATVRDLASRAPHVGYGVGLELHTERSLLARLSLASSRDGVVMLDLSLEPVFAIEPRERR